MLNDKYGNAQTADGLRSQLRLRETKISIYYGQLHATSPYRGPDPKPAEGSSPRSRGHQSTLRAELAHQIARDTRNPSHQHTGVSVTA